MATIKMACPKCYQRVSGDETFYGKTVICPVCDTKIVFPKEGEEIPPLPERPVHDQESAKRLAAYEKTLRETKNEKPAGEPPRVTGRREKEQKKAPRPEKREPAATPAPANPIPAAVAGGTAATAGAGATGPKTKEPPPNSGAALWSMVFGIAAFALCPIGPLLAFPAIVLGHAGRGSIHRSLGKLGGMGMATAGLMLGYFYMIALALLILVGPWKSVGSYVIQGYNDQTATAIVTALGSYAEDNGGKFPSSIEDLVPDYFPQDQLDASKWIDPGTFPFVKRYNYAYYPGHTGGDDPKTILVSAPEPDGTYRRLVAYLDGSVEILPEEEFIRRTLP